ncbi:flagellar protein FliT [Caballeronia sp. EK]|uniref:flagellar protein FliT n=1 Tax=Caballeronia sp. EK TaxID=2767469 RepID=UPI001656153D|nr:flagellar protein FliT [Caballeronia sp. EK]MBC8641964.1 flagellar protein FliT [Caballeronia sp. EK]
MKTSEEYITFYDTVAAVSCQMLAAARSGEWNELDALDGTFRELIAQLKTVDPDLSLDGGARARKLAVVMQILANDAEIRDLTFPSLADLASLLTTNGPAPCGASKPSRGSIFYGIAEDNTFIQL